MPVLIIPSVVICQVTIILVYKPGHVKVEARVLVLIELFFDRYFLYFLTVRNPNYIDDYSFKVQNIYLRLHDYTNHLYKSYI